MGVYRKTGRQRSRDREILRQKEEGRRVRIKEQERRDGKEENCSLRKEKNKRENILKIEKDKYIDTQTWAPVALCT